MPRFIPALSWAALGLFLGCEWASPPDASSIEMKGGLPGNTYVDQTFEGKDLKGHDGRKVFVRLGGPEPIFHERERTAAGSVPIEHGTFRLHFLGAREEGLYKPYVVFVDLTGDGRCTPRRDLGFRGATGGGALPYVIEVEGSQLLPVGEEDCAFFHGAWRD